MASQCWLVHCKFKQKQSNRKFSIKRVHFPIGASQNKQPLVNFGKILLNYDRTFWNLLTCKQLEVVEELSSEWKVSEQEDSLDDDSSSLKYPASLISSVWSVWT